MRSVIGDLPAAWKERAQYLRDFGDPNAARLWDIAVAEIEAALAVERKATLSLTETARGSGYTADHLGALVKQGKITNAGRTGAPRIRRSDLPMKNAGGPSRPTRPGSVPTREESRRIATSTSEER